MEAEVVVENVFGAIIFWAYIAAALLFTGIIIRSLLELHSKSLSNHTTKDKGLADQHVDRRRSMLPIFIMLAAISFSNLSYHMLSFLIESYTSWARRNGILLMDPSPDLYDVATYLVQNVRTHAWRWSKASTLFREFAEVICNDPSRFWWTQTALLYSYKWSMNMSVEGVRYRIPHLWAYFVLAQILPISFAQNLFCIALCLVRAPTQDSEYEPASRNLQRTLFCAYAISLNIAPYIASKRWLLVVLFVTRALLFAPYYLLAPKSRASGTNKILGKQLVDGVEWQFVNNVTIVLVLWQAYKNKGNVGEAIHSSPAVSALAYDFCINTVSWVPLARAQS